MNRLSIHSQAGHVQKLYLQLCTLTAVYLQLCTLAQSAVLSFAKDMIQAIQAGL